jgi:NAD(P)-dependent dehydrogenase (short-subunit alcohol dehydrogenase family)
MNRKQEKQPILRADESWLRVGRGALAKLLWSTSRKGALTNYSKGLSKEVAPKCIRVNTVAPGYTETQATQGMINEIVQRTGISGDAARQRSWTHSAAFH